MTTATDDRVEFAAVLGAEGVPFAVIQQVMKDTRTLHRLAEKECNYGLTDRDRKREAAAEVRISKALIEYGIGAQFQGDPRGAVVKLRLPSGRSNDWGGEGLYCVPSR